MTGHVDRASAWIYRGVWRVVVDWLRVPPPPDLPAAHGEEIQRFHPAPGFLKYLKFWFWLVLTLIDGAIAAGWVVLVIWNRPVGIALAPIALLVAVVPDVIAFIAIRLRYDTTWYVLSERSMRLRRGVWNITEVTITFENVQNVKVKSGPMQRAFGISNVIVETAGSGGGGGEHQPAITNKGLIEGVDNAHEIRDLIMSRVRASRSTGLGDEAIHRPKSSLWSEQHIQTLREIRDEVAQLQEL